MRSHKINGFVLYQENKKKIVLYINDVNAPFNHRKLIFREQGKVVGVEKKRN